MTEPNLTPTPTTTTDTTPTPADGRRITLRISGDLRQRLEAVAKAMGKTLSEVAVACIERHLPNIENRA